VVADRTSPRDGASDDEPAPQAEVERARPAPAVSKAAAVVPQAPLPVVTVRSTGFLKTLRAAPAGRIGMPQLGHRAA
jgi:hypothetical protein